MERAEHEIERREASGGMSGLPSGNTSISIERSTRNGSPAASNVSFNASIRATCAARRSSLIPFAIVRLFEWSVLAMNGRPRSRAASRVFSIASLPSLAVLCTWRSACGVPSHEGSGSRTRRTSASVRKSRRVSSGSGTAGGSSNHPWIFAPTQGPTERSSVRDRPAAATSPASSGQNIAAREAR